MIVAIDGDCGAGKTTLAAMLQAHFAARGTVSVIPMDHFFKQPRPRIAEAVMRPLSAGQAFSYRPYDCRLGAFGAEIEVPSSLLYIVEGAYSLHPDLAVSYDLTVFLSLPPRAQLLRLARRGSDVARFQREWIPKEKQYFAAFDLARKADIHIEGGDARVGFDIVQKRIAAGRPAIFDRPTR